MAAVAAVSGIDPAEMDPLAEVIDPDALDALFDARHDGTPRADGTTRFSFFDYGVVVTGSGRISILDATP
ncbi:HalOD1 output domain-containing protein [Halorussus caseinilyticus]|uniref:HalOD1 output domain-containing protein n=1 Tax=Halorussus caseinilyticus TaxID=3034025 RepID=A0ABD5WPW2_9EURY